MVLRFLVITVVIFLSIIAKIDILIDKFTFLAGFFDNGDATPNSYTPALDGGVYLFVAHFPHRLVKIPFGETVFSSPLRIGLIEI